MNKRKIVVTGATGFLGKALVITLSRLSDIEVIAMSRNVKNEVDNVTSFLCDSYVDPQAIEQLTDSHTVIHCAARVHMMQDYSEDPLIEFRKSNTDLTLHLARQAAALNVKRFIFISTIKVNGENTTPYSPFTANSPPNPSDPYAISKWEAEEGLKKIAAETQLEIVIIRPVLTYGPEVKGNFLNIMKLLDTGIPLPFSLIRNKRSLIALDNLVDLIINCVFNSSAANKVFLASDDYDISTAELLKYLSSGMKRKLFLLPLPPILLKAAAAIFGKRELFDRIAGSLVVDIHETKSTLNWKPPLNAAQALIMTGESFTKNK